MTIKGKISEFDGSKSRTLTTRCQRPKKRFLYEIITNNNFKTGQSPTAETTSFPLPPWVSKSPKSRPRQQDAEEAKDIEKAKEAKGATETKDCKYKTQKAGYIQEVSQRSDTQESEVDSSSPDLKLGAFAKLAMENGESWYDDSESSSLTKEK